MGCTSERAWFCCCLNAVLNCSATAAGEMVGWTPAAIDCIQCQTAEKMIPTLLTPTLPRTVTTHPEDLHHIHRTRSLAPSSVTRLRARHCSTTVGERFPSHQTTSFDSNDESHETRKESLWTAQHSASGGHNTVYNLIPQIVALCDVTEVVHDVVRSGGCDNGGNGGCTAARPVFLPRLCKVTHHHPCID
jgi:hypothetical protein